VVGHVLAVYSLVCKLLLVESTVRKRLDFNDNTVQQARKSLGGFWGLGNKCSLIGHPSLFWCQIQIFQTVTNQAKQTPVFFQTPSCVKKRCRHFEMCGRSDNIVTVIIILLLEYRSCVDLDALESTMRFRLSVDGCTKIEGEPEIHTREIVDVHPCRQATHFTFTLPLFPVYCALYVVRCAESEMDFDPTYEFNAPTEYTDLNALEHPGDEYFGTFESDTH
jgi:hypothetical protein